jgi:hypothetical protein
MQVTTFLSGHKSYQLNLSGTNPSPGRPTHKSKCLAEAKHLFFGYLRQ